MYEKGCGMDRSHQSKSIRWPGYSVVQLGRTSRSRTSAPRGKSIGPLIRVGINPGWKWHNAFALGQALPLGRPRRAVIVMCIDSYQVRCDFTAILTGRVASRTQGDRVAGPGARAEPTRNRRDRRLPPRGRVGPWRVPSRPARPRFRPVIISRHAGFAAAHNPSQAEPPTDCSESQWNTHTAVRMMRRRSILRNTDERPLVTSEHVVAQAHHHRHTGGDDAGRLGNGLDREATGHYPHLDIAAKLAGKSER